MFWDQNNCINTELVFFENIYYSIFQYRAILMVGFFSSH